MILVTLVPDSKSLCDGKFLSDMLSVVKSETRNLGESDEGLGGVLAQIAADLVRLWLTGQANAYFAAVAHTSVGTNAFCDATTNPAPSECFPDIDPRDALSSNGITYTGNDEFGFYHIDCDLLVLPDGNGGYTVHEFNCDITALP